MLKKRTALNLSLIIETLFFSVSIFHVMFKPNHSFTTEYWWESNISSTRCHMFLHCLYMFCTVSLYLDVLKAINSQFAASFLFSTCLVATRLISLFQQFGSDTFLLRREGLSMQILLQNSRIQMNVF